MALLNSYREQPNDFAYQAVMAELLNGSSFLLTPTLNEINTGGDWITLNKGTRLKFTGIFNLDGLKVLAVFTDEESMLNWSKEPRQYVAINTETIFDICKDMGIARVVINSDSPTMFVLQRNLENVTSRIIQEKTPIKVGTPSKPLRPEVINKLKDNFKKTDTILEAYQYMQEMNTELSIILGIRLSVVTENSRLAVQNAVQNSIESEKLDYPLDVMILETDEWLKTVKGIQNSLFYTK